MSFFDALHAALLWSSEKNTATTRALLDDVVYRAIHEHEAADLYHFGDDHLIHIMRCLKDLLGHDQLQNFLMVVDHYENGSLSAVKIIDHVLNKHFRQDGQNFIFVICIFTLMDILFWKEYKDMCQANKQQLYLDNLNPSILHPLYDMFETGLGQWVFLNGGWQTLLENFTNDITKDGRELMAKLCTSMLDLHVVM